MAKTSFYQEVLDLSLSVERNIQLVEETEIKKKRYKDLSTKEDEDGEGQDQNIEERKEKVNQELEVCSICHRFYRGEC
jgi:ribosomal protein L31